MTGMGAVCPREVGDPILSAMRKGVEVMRVAASEGTGSTARGPENTGRPSWWTGLTGTSGESDRLAVLDSESMPWLNPKCRHKGFCYCVILCMEACFRLAFWGIEESAEIPDGGKMDRRSPMERIPGDIFLTLVTMRVFLMKRSRFHRKAT